MAEKQPIRTAVRSVLVIVFLVVASSSVFPISNKERFWEEMDVSNLLTAVKHRAQIPDGDCETLVRQNLKHIYFNALQTDRFLGMPKPDRIVNEACTVFKLSDELEALLQEARSLPPEEIGSGRLAKAARKIGDRAGALHRRFQEFFREDNLTECSVALDLSQPLPARFARYLEHCEEIRKTLDSQLDHYFLNPSPDIIELSAYRTCSITELSLSLRELSYSFEKSLSAR